MGSGPLKSIHGTGVFSVNINVCACATARATFDKPTAVNYELACGEGDSLVNMQCRRSAQSPRNTSVRPPPHPEWQGLTWVSITSPRAKHQDRGRLEWTQKPASLTHIEIRGFKFTLNFSVREYKAYYASLPDKHL